MLTIVDYLRSRGWQPTLERDHFVKGYCPIHMEHTPSFTIYPAHRGAYQKEHFYCYGGGCRETGDVIKLIWLLECGRDTQRWREAFDRFKFLNGGIPFSPELKPGRLTSVYRLENPPATREQRTFMTMLMACWHAELQGNSLGAISARIYLATSGLPHDLPQLGYIPSREDSKYVRQFFSHLSSAWGKDKDWQEMGNSVGLLRSDHSLNLSHRIVYGCVHDGQIVGYQARVMPDSTEKIKFLNTPHMKKFFFTVPLEARYPGTVITESPKGPAILSQYGVRGVATLGEVRDFSQLIDFPQPFWLCQDNDEAHTREDGSIYYPGDEEANTIATHCCQEGWEYYRIRPPRQYKDLDTWVNRQGPEPLLREMKRCQLSCAA